MLRGGIFNAAPASGSMLPASAAFRCAKKNAGKASWQAGFADLTGLRNLTGLNRICNNNIL